MEISELQSKKAVLESQIGDLEGSEKETKASLKEEFGTDDPKKLAVISAGLKEEKIALEKEYNAKIEELNQLEKGN